jgi:hypothetical protein
LFIDYYRSLMTNRLDISSPMQVDPLSNKLMEILKERHALQLRTQELERMVRVFYSSLRYLFSFRKRIFVNELINVVIQTINR